MNAKSLTDRALLPAILFAVCILTILAEANAQTGPGHAPLPPPETAPESRLTVSPSEFEHWLSATQGAEESAEAKAPRAEEPALVTAPPTAPPPRLVAPPPPPTLAPTPGLSREAPADGPNASAPATPAPAPTLTPTQKLDEQPAPADRPAAPPPEPQQKSVPEPPAEQQVTTLPPDAPTAPAPAPPGEPLVASDVVTILYEEGAMEVPDAAKPELDRVAAWMRQNPSARMQIVGYAKGKTAAMASDAKRTSLYRTLAVRKYLVESGLLSTRMNLCAMGARTKEPPEDRVQLFMETGSGARQCEEFVE